MKLFKINNREIIKCCLQEFNIDLPSVTVTRRSFQ